MTDIEKQALEALYQAVHRRPNHLFDLDKLSVPITAVTLNELRQQGFIAPVGRGHLTITWLGVRQARANKAITP